jgi:hypothetical protein
VVAAFFAYQFMFRRSAGTTSLVAWDAAVPALFAADVVAADTAPAAPNAASDITVATIAILPNQRGGWIAGRGMVYTLSKDV